MMNMKLSWNSGMDYGVKNSAKVEKLSKSRFKLTKWDRGAASLVPGVLVHPQFSNSVKNCHMKMQ